MNKIIKEKKEMVKKLPQIITNSAIEILRPTFEKELGKKTVKEYQEKFINYFDYSRSVYSIEFDKWLNDERLIPLIGEVIIEMQLDANTKYKLYRYLLNSNYSKGVKNHIELFLDKNHVQKLTDNQLEGIVNESSIKDIIYALYYVKNTKLFDMFKDTYEYTYHVSEVIEELVSRFKFDSVDMIIAKKKIIQVEIFNAILDDACMNKNNRFDLISLLNNPNLTCLNQDNILSITKWLSNHSEHKNEALKIIYDRINNNTLDLYDYNGESLKNIYNEMNDDTKSAAYYSLDKLNDPILKKTL